MDLISGVAVIDKLNTHTTYIHGMVTSDSPPCSPVTHALDMLDLLGEVVVLVEEPVTCLAAFTHTVHLE